MKKIVIIEDDPVVGLVYRNGLLKEGFDVEVVTDGATGLARIQETRPAGVILDMIIPNMPGVEVLKKIRGEPEFARTPVVVFTNAHVPMIVESVMAAGATKVLDKSDATPHKVAEILKAAGC